MGEDRSDAPDQVLRSWDDRSSVRSKPRNIVAEIEAGKTLFPRALLPITEHEALLNLHPCAVDTLLSLRLFLYIDFTTSLEQEVVNPVLVAISKNPIGLEFSPGLRLDAHRIYVDEAYHALAAVDLAHQVSALVATPYTRTDQHEFITRLQQVLRRAPRSEVPLVAMAAATVSETLVSGTLCRIPQDESVAQVVRDVVAEHASDERTHHAYFTRLHETMWPRLSRRNQLLLAPLYADFILGFLAPDKKNLKVILQRAGVPEVIARKVINETYESLDLMPGIRHSARATIRLLQRTGVMEITEAHDKFEAKGLLV